MDLKMKYKQETGRSKTQMVITAEDYELVNGLIIDEKAVEDFYDGYCGTISFPHPDYVKWLEEKQEGVTA
jgi:hypothetical protein